MRHSLYYSLVVVFALLTIATACTDRKAEDNVSEVVRTARADRKQAIEYDGLWQMRLAEMYYKKAYESLQDDPSQDWFTYGDAGYRYAFLTCNRGDVEGALAIVNSNEALKGRFEAESMKFNPASTFWVREAAGCFLSKKPQYYDASSGQVCKATAGTAHFRLSIAYFNKNK